MPIYEYECQKCGHHLEKMQGMNDKPLTRCPECKGKLEKKWSQTSFQLKGSGWYVTDYAAKGQEKKSESSGETKGEKPATAESGKSDSDKKSSESGKSTESTESKPAKSKEKKSSSKSSD